MTHRCSVLGAIIIKKTAYLACRENIGYLAYLVCEDQEGGGEGGQNQALAKLGLG